jgi:hypothetical protein
VSEIPVILLVFFGLIAMFAGCLICVGVAGLVRFLSKRRKDTRQREFEFAQRDVSEPARRSED